MEWDRYRKSTKWLRSSQPLSCIVMRTPQWGWCERLKRMRYIKAISRSSKRLESLQRNWGSPLTWVFRTPSAVTTQMEQMCPQIRSRGTSKRLQLSNGKLKSRKRNGKESSSQRDGRRISWTSGVALSGWRIWIRRLHTPSRGCLNFMDS